MSKEEILQAGWEEVGSLGTDAIHSAWPEIEKYAKNTAIEFGKFCVDNAWRIDKLIDSELTYNGLYELWEIEKIKQSTKNPTTHE